MLYILCFKDTVRLSLCVHVFQWWMQKGRKRGDCHSEHKTDHTSHLAVLKPTGTREREENPAVPACQYSLPARWEAGSTWQMPLGSIIPEGWKDPPHNGKPVKQEETGIPNEKKNAMWSQRAMFNEIFICHICMFSLFDNAFNIFLHGFYKKTFVKYRAATLKWTISWKKSTKTLMLSRLFESFLKQKHSVVWDAQMFRLQVFLCFIWWWVWTAVCSKYVFDSGILSLFTDKSVNWIIAVAAPVKQGTVNVCYYSSSSSSISFIGRSCRR